MNKETGILFKPDMIKAILDGRKTMTRRVLKPQPIVKDFLVEWHTKRLGAFTDINEFGKDPAGAVLHECPYGGVGDLLYVKEATYYDIISHPEGGYVEQYLYKSDYDSETAKNIKFTSPLFMPKAAARIWLEITDVKVERLHQISEEDVIAEGIEWKIQNPETEPGIKYYKDYQFGDKYGFYMIKKAKTSFMTLWNLIHGEDNMMSNPWLWCISFKRINHA